MPDVESSRETAEQTTGGDGAQAPAADFDLFAFRLEFTAQESVYFPPGKSGNIVRGAFGTSRENAGIAIANVSPLSFCIW